ncbi:hypothetical protein [Microvirga sp. TS319]|uniref:hypothetical protein n=1 Tax=Microvirga sp. TS319 TaxID=3241165 RepID=UPI00351A0B0B
MRHPVLPNLDEPDLDARQWAKGAARRAGLSLEEWAAAILVDKDARRASPLQEREPNSPEPGGAAPRHARTARPELERTFETLMAAVAAQGERQAQDHASRTAIALESMASWIEQTEERLNETARASADHQDRMATALSQALSTLRSRLDSVERQAVAERQAQPEAPWNPAIDAIQAEMERLRASVDNLATQEELASLGRALKDIAKEIAHGPASKDLLILAQSTAAIYRQIRTLSEDVSGALNERIGGEIDELKARVERIAETGIDRSVIDFLSSQIVDLRHDLSHRAEPRQIERLSKEVTAIADQVADLRGNQVERSDFSALKTSLENVCAALNRTAAMQEASDMPSQLDTMSRDLAALASRPAPETADLDPIADQLAFLTERMAELSEDRFRQNDALGAMIERLSAQVQVVADKEPLPREALMQRFDTVEETLRQIGERADISVVEPILRGIDEKLDRTSSAPLSLEALDQQIGALAERLAERSGEPLQKILDEATHYLRHLQTDAAEIAERAAKTALKDLQPSLPVAADIDALKQGFVELKALQSRADKKTQETLRAVHGALETLISRFPERIAGEPRSAPPGPSGLDPSSRPMPPTDRLEAAVRRLHAVTLSQVEEVATTGAEAHGGPIGSEVITHQPADEDFGNVRASFIAAARRAAQVDKADDSALPSETGEEMALEEFGAMAAEQGSSVSPASLMERIRRSFDAHRRSLLLGLGLVVLATGAVHVVSSGLVPSSLPLIVSGSALRADSHPKARSSEETTETGSIAAPLETTNLFQPSSLATTIEPALTAPGADATPKFLIDPATVGDIPVTVPAPLREAARAGDASALYEIASRAAEGRGLPQDMPLATHLYERAAQAGLPPAQERLATLMEKGIGRERDPKQAAIWYERAAQGGNIHAMHNLATLLVSGLNGKPDYATAYRWYSEAAEAGLKDSQFNVGVLLARGIGTKQDYAKAYMWLALAAAQGDTEAAKKRDELAGRLSAAERKATQASIERWQPRPVDPFANGVPAPSGGQTAALNETSDKRS